MSKPVVLIAEELSPATIDALGPEFEVRHCDGANREELLAALSKGVDAVLIRSATKMDAEAMAAAKGLKVVARAGVGLDNVDVPAATAAGVMVVNAPTSNIVSAAELAIGLLISSARFISPAHAALRNGKWARSKFTGVELYEKTLGIVGLGRIGQLVASRMLAFGMEVIAYDPYLPEARANHLGVKLVDLDALLRTSDFITVHLPKTKETAGLIGFDALTKVKPSVRIVNAARGGVVDEIALHAALKEGRIGGAGLDVYSTEPCTDSPLFEFDSVVATPHLGASTDEAQERAGIAVAVSVRKALAGELVPDAVNVKGGVIHEDLRPALPLAETLGQLISGLAVGAVSDIEVEVCGELAELDCEILATSAIKGLLMHAVGEGVSYVNAPLLAKERGLTASVSKNSISELHRNVITLTATATNGERITVSGTLTGLKRITKLISINDLSIDVEPTNHMLFVSYADRPGVVGSVGALLGNAAINIAGMQVARKRPGGDALMILTVDEPIAQDVVDDVANSVQARSAHYVALV
ncbi:MAG: phosphoglycerate dehydrogenase [Actinobacteria bacterium]|uniref:D-3-phosphoglycerate dehydrogenase n=1 Tax=freshwater metagenome TaxID=449393 RepID=A0A6J7T2H0_9ZZZZ|nr:phosphoglycerate dehydrogenase [Actinomycetota bacterium]MTB13963.1 phosphoglycerate dehydrogenase [Actinomycetota bacterium]